MLHGCNAIAPSCRFIPQMMYVEQRILRLARNMDMLRRVFVQQRCVRVGSMG